MLRAGSCVLLQPLPPLKPGGAPRTFVVLQSHVDANMGVPTMLVTFVLRVSRLSQLGAFVGCGS